MDIAIEIFLVTVVAGLAALSFSKAPINGGWLPEFSWKIVGILFGVLSIVFNIIYFFLIKK